MPFLSIIVPVYNVENYLEECINSILTQTFKDYELILVDDGSTDRSGAICDQYREKNEAIKIIHKENGGSTSARKAGISVACGKYIGYVDADDKIKHTMYQKMCEEASKSDADIIICDVLQWDGKNTFQIEQSMEGGVFTKTQLNQNIYPHMLYSGRYYQFGFLPAMWNKIYRSDILKKNLLLVDERIRIGEDVACSYLCILDANKVSYLKNEFEYYYRLNKDSQCQKWTNRNISSASILLDYLYNQLIERKNTSLIEQYWYYYCYMFTNMIYEYGEAVRRKQITNNVEKDFEEIMNSKSFQVFKTYYETIKIPFNIRIVSNSVIYGRAIDKIMWKIFAKIRKIYDNVYKIKKNIFRRKT